MPLTFYMRLAYEYHIEIKHSAGKYGLSFVFERQVRNASPFPSFL
jgi:hypothetical protein